MTSTGRQAAIGLIATLLAGTAGCAASPQYPIARGQAGGDGGLHMTAHPQYPIGDGRNAPSRAYNADPDQARPAPTAPRPSDDDDMPRAVPSAPVQSSPQARNDGRPHLDFGLAEVPPQLEFAAYHHHHAAPAADDDAPAPKTRAEKAKAAKEEKAEARSGRHHGKADDISADDAKTDDTKASRRRRHGKETENADAAPADDKAGDMPLAVTLKPGERLATVAKRLHISKQALMQVNGISPDDKVLPGSTLKTPYRYAYEIKKGDTLYAIGHRFHMDTDDLAKLNALKHAGALQPGQTVELPASVADAGARDHAHGDGLVPVGAPDKLIATMTRQERRAADREAAKEARLERRHPHHETEVAQAESTPEPAPTRASRRHRFTPPPTGLTTSNVPSVMAQSATTAPEPATPEPAPYVASTQTASRPAYTPPTVVPARPPVSVASEMAADTAPHTAMTTPSASASAASASAASAATAARQTVSSSDTGLTTARPATAYGATATTRTPTYPYGAAAASRTPATGYAATTPPRATSSYPYGATASTPAATSYRAPATASTTPSYPAATGATPWRAPTTTATTPGYPASTYGSAAASAPTRVASLNTPTYGSPYGAPSLGRPRPNLSTAAGGASNAEVAAAGHGRFVWPLRGAILEPFGDKGPGQRNDGLDIVAQPGESVRAAASGEVVYAGSSIPGFGNLILVKHTGGWVTAYAHLDRIEVRMRDSVTQGQEIGQAGQTGAVDRPQLHFEVRYAPQADEKARPVDPTLVLPGAG